MRPLLAALSAMAGAVAASLCCLPVLPFLAAAGSGAAVGLVPVSARPWIMAFAVAMLGFGFWQAYRRNTCSRQQNLAARSVLWLATIAMAAMAFFPQRTAALLAGPSAAVATDSITTLDSVDPLRDSFQRAHGQTRIIALLSPT